MGTSTDALLVYGYNLNDKIEEDDRNALGAMVHKLFAHLFETRHDLLDELVMVPDDDDDDWYEETQAIAKYLGVDFEYHCRDNYKMYILAGRTVRSYRGDVREIDPIDLIDTKGDITSRLRIAADVLGLEGGPKWFLVSYWG